MVSRRAAMANTIALLVGLSLLLLPTSIAAQSPAAKDYRDPNNFVTSAYIPLDDYAFPWPKDLGILRGSFYEMGVQFGERDADGIFKNVEYLILPGVLKNYESMEQFRSVLAQYKAQHAAFTPQWMDFVAGAAVGAGPVLKECRYAKDLSPFDIMFALNISVTLSSPPKWRMKQEGIGSSVSSVPQEEEALACNGVWVTGPATKYGQSLTLFANHHGALYPHYKAIMVPSDPKANVVFVTGSSGRLFHNGYMFSDKGIGYHNLASGVSGDQFRDFGVETYVLLAHAAWFAKTVDEAVEIVTTGTPEYREKTQRKTLLRARSNLVAITGKDDACVVEYTAHRYAIRRPGDLGEKDKSYMAFSNNFFCDHSYDENNVRTSQSIMEYAGSSPAKLVASAERAYTLMWLVKNNYGKIDKDMLMYEFAPTHSRYKEDGTVIEPQLNKDGLFEPIASVCSHSIGKRLPSGSMRTVVELHDNLDVWSVPAWPCLFVGQPWDYDSIYWKRPASQ